MMKICQFAYSSSADSVNQPPILGERRTAMSGPHLRRIAMNTRQNIRQASTRQGISSNGSMSANNKKYRGKSPQSRYALIPYT